MNELKGGERESNKLKKILSDSAVTNPHIPNLINITQRLVKLCNSDFIAFTSTSIIGKGLI